MRSWIYILVIGLTMSACTDSKQTGVTISVLEDVTETDFLATPTAQSLVSKFDLFDNPWQFARFRYGTMNSLIHNRRSELHIEGATALLGNQLIRDVEIATFQKGIDSILNIPKNDKVYNYSSIWKPLVEELKHLQKDTISQTTLCVYSDLQENNGNWFSVHRYADLKLLETNPEKVKALFSQRASNVLKGSSNINVVVVYQPQTMKQDKVFTMMKKLYSDVFAEMDISIEFVSHLN